MAHRDGRHLDRPPSLPGHCGHGPMFIAQRSVANDPSRMPTLRRNNRNHVGLCEGRGRLRPAIGVNRTLLGWQVLPETYSEWDIAPHLAESPQSAAETPPFRPFHLWYKVLIVASFGACRGLT